MPLFLMILFLARKERNYSSLVGKMEGKHVLISPVILFLGHIQLTYFSRWMEVEDSCDSEAMERMYCAPG